jgi:hypothetical protein
MVFVLDSNKQPLKDAAAMNSLRWALWRELSALGLPLEVGTGRCTKFNIHPKHLTLLQRADGYAYAFGNREERTEGVASPAN